MKKTMQSYKQQYHFFLFIIFFSMGSISKGDIVVILPMLSLGFYAYFFIAFMQELKKSIPYFSLYYFGSYILCFGIYIMSKILKLSTDAQVGLSFIIVFSLFPFFSKVEKKLKELNKNH